MKISKKQLLTFLVLLTIILSASYLILVSNIDAVSAANSLLDKQIGLEDEIGGAFGETDKPTDIRATVAGVVKSFLGILGIVFLVLIVSAGYKWMIAGGNDDKVNESKAQLGRAFIGLMIILMAWFVTTFVMNCLVDIAGIEDFKFYCP